MIPLPWSHSTLEKFKTCPKQFYHVKVTKDVIEKPGEAAEWGNRLHKAFELALDTNEALPEELASYQQYIDRIGQFEGTRYVEKKLGVTKDLRGCDFSDVDVWARGIIDVLVIRGDRAFILDHKTGRIKPSTQLMLNALLVFANYPEVEECTTAFYWLKHDEITRGSHKRTDSAMLWNSYTDDLRNYNFAFEHDVWTPKQSGLCNGWCSVKQCQFWREKRT